MNPFVAITVASPSGLSLARLLHEAIKDYGAFMAEKAGKRYSPLDTGGDGFESRPEVDSNQLVNLLLSSNPNGRIYYTQKILSITPGYHNH